MPRSNFYRLRIAFSDCDPAQIVFFANYFKWFDTSTFEFFAACGLPSWRETSVSDSGIIGTLVNATARFVSSATYGEDISIETWVHEWRSKSFVMRHVARRDETVLVEGEDVRVFAIRDPARPLRIKAIPIPADIRALCERPITRRPA